ncbi:DUF4870 domain-containing protein [Lysinibacillus endophyticus]|uniref:DUF4870 domain-containing protein n=1 Tax=Ureibacillus endophyticus TaxID=1978490 RepID=A0A494ZBA8_9BACL|nr:DUF4870 domain-containing protein [Lysinibacillus endophyticus]MCP1145989.1 DUF4870 domain-containing protein [Lysinibacillus endophyticus]RKQ19382.1 hypothetical protein D8M03_03215 [Lysinibacillus endophyticus]
MDNNKIISALCYVSLLFAPFLLPLIVYLVINNNEVKYHAKRAFISHLIPVVIGMLLGIFGIFGIFSVTSTEIMNGFVISLFIFMAIYFLITIILLIWNLIQAVRVLKA